MIIFCKQRADDVKYFAEDGRIENVYVEIKLDCKLQFQAKKTMILNFNQNTEEIVSL